MREIARLVQAGASTADIATAIGLSRNVASQHARKIRLAIGIDHPLERARKERMARIGQLLSAGGTNLGVAAELGIGHNAVSAARRELGLSGPTRLRLDASEYAEIDRRLIAGDRTRLIADETGMSLDTISKRARAIRHLIPVDFPPCRCGRSHNHTGACRLMPEVIQYVRDQLAAGRRMEWIGPEVGLSVKQLREYALPIIAELQAAGMTCHCGREVSHGRPYCRETHHRPVDVAFQAQVKALLEQGKTRLAIAKLLGCSYPKVNRVAKPIMAEMAAAGVKCQCGQPIDHGKTCAARGAAPKFDGFVFSKAARKIPLAKRYRAAKLAQEGTLRHTCSTEMHRSGVPEAQIDTAAGHSGETTNKKHYRHLRPDYLQEFVAGVEAFWAEVGQHTTAHLRSHSDPKIIDLGSARAKRPAKNG